MDETGIVLEVKPDYVKLLMRSGASCNGCNACAVGSGQSRVLTLKNGVDCKPGDQITVAVHPISPYISIFTLFVMPLIFILLFYGLADRFLPSTLNAREMITVFISVLGFIAGFPAIKLVDNLLHKHENAFITIKKIENGLTS